MNLITYKFIRSLRYLIQQSDILNQSDSVVRQVVDGREDGGGRDAQECDVDGTLLPRFQEVQTRHHLILAERVGNDVREGHFCPKPLFLQYFFT